MAARNRLLESRQKSLESLSVTRLPSDIPNFNTSNSYLPSREQNGENGGRHVSHSAKENGRLPEAHAVENGAGKGTSTNNGGQISIKATDDHNQSPGKAAEDDSPTFLQKVFSWRGAIVLLLHTSFIVNVLPRNTLSMALVCMVDPSKGGRGGGNATAVSRNGSHDDAAGGISRNDTGVEVKQYEFDWDSELQGLILTGIQFVSFIGPIISNVVKNLIGSKNCLTAITLAGAFFSIISPWAARVSPYFLLAIRILAGLFMGGNVPVVGDALAWWTPDSEKLTWVACSFAGVNVGGVVSSLISGFMCAIPVDNGWPFIFYVTGGLSCLWIVVWHFLSAEKPELHPYITDREKTYIVAKRLGMGGADKKGTKSAKTPYKKIFTSVPVSAYVIASACHIWSMNVTFSYMPMYMTSVLRLSVEETGVVFASISSARFVGMFLWTGLGNFLLTRPSMTKNKVRKICIFSGFASAGATNLAISFFDHEYRGVAIGVLTLLMMAQSVGSSILTVIPLDMAPRYAGVISGFNFSFGMALAISGPLLVSVIAPTNSFEEWRVVWIIMAILFTSAAFIYVTLGQASLQPWAEGQKRPDVPNIVAPFVSMGRRFSSFVEAPPLSPVLTPATRLKRFNFSLNAQLASMLPALTETRDGIIIADQLHLQLDLSPQVQTTRPSFADAGTQTGEDPDVFQKPEERNRAALENESFNPEPEVFVTQQSLRDAIFKEFDASENLQNAMETKLGDTASIDTVRPQIRTVMVNPNSEGSTSLSESTNF